MIANVNVIVKQEGKADVKVRAKVNLKIAQLLKQILKDDYEPSIKNYTVIANDMAISDFNVPLEQCLQNLDTLSIVLEPKQQSQVAQNESGYLPGQQRFDFIGKEEVKREQSIIGSFYQGTLVDQYQMAVLAEDFSHVRYQTLDGSIRGIVKLEPNSHSKLDVPDSTVSKQSELRGYRLKFVTGKLGVLAEWNNGQNRACLFFDYQA